MRRNSLVMPVHRLARALGRGLTATTIVATIVVPAARAASAGPVGDAKAQAAALAQKINAEAQQVNALAEQYDGAQYHLSQVTQDLANAEQGLAAARAKADRSRAALANEAVAAYMRGGVTTAAGMTSFNGSVDLSVQQGYFRLAVGDQANALDQLRADEQSLRQRQATLESARADSQAALDAVTGRRRAVEAAAAASQATLNQVQGQLVQLVAQQQIQIAAQQQAQVRASLLAAQTKSSQAATTAPAGPPPAHLPAGPTTGPGTAGPGPASTTSPTVATSRTSVAPPTTKAPAPSAPPTTIALPPVPAPSAAAGTAVAYARAQIGKPYQWGGAGPDSFDCSGLTMRAWGAAGVSLPHYAAAQYADTAHVPIADLQPGDLVFFGSDLHHVGIYIGAGQMIDAPSTGEFVRIDSIYWSDLQPYGGRPS